ncbi:MAG: hypothetical protein L0213_11545, partial [Candidatus Dadabacteria bacterium]|nr:hypothetical protein [Candidatus Dadabacteria bacterium]
MSVPKPSTEWPIYHMLEKKGRWVSFFIPFFALLLAPLSVGGPACAAQGEGETATERLIMLERPAPKPVEEDRYTAI